MEDDGRLQDSLYLFAKLLPQILPMYLESKFIEHGGREQSHFATWGDFFVYFNL